MGDIKTNLEISDLLESAVKSKLDNYTIIVDEGNKKGQGYLADFLILTLKNKETEEELHLVIKQANFQNDLITESFKTETYFYSTILPSFHVFQKSYAPELANITIAPKCLATNSQTTIRRIVLENLKYLDFEITDRTKNFDKAHLELVLKTYAKLHALSFAMKDKEPQKYLEMIQPFKEQTEQFQKLFFMPTFIKKRVKRIINLYNGKLKNEIIEKMLEYEKNVEQLFFECFKYFGSYSVINHGDCWSNNLMFKYNDSKQPTEIRLLDFQLSRIASPIHDLSYAIYSSASKEVLDELDDYLNVYHETLSSVLQEFGCTPEVIYPYNVLQDEWKKYSKYGFMWALVAWIGKLIVSNVPSVEDLGNVSKKVEPKFDEEIYDKVISNLVLHMYENDYL